RERRRSSVRRAKATRVGRRPERACGERRRARGEPALAADEPAGDDPSADLAVHSSTGSTRRVAVPNVWRASVDLDVRKTRAGRPRTRAPLPAGQVRTKRPGTVRLTTAAAGVGQIGRAHV